jgi:hypothetical protein
MSLYYSPYNFHIKCTNYQEIFPLSSTVGNFTIKKYAIVIFPYKFHSSYFIDPAVSLLFHE